MTEIVRVDHLEIWRDTTTREVSYSIDRGPRMVAADYNPDFVWLTRDDGASPVVVGLDGKVYVARRGTEWITTSDES